MATNIQNIIKEICKDLNIEYKLLSKEWVTELKYNNIKQYIVGYKFPLNNHCIGEILDDKYATYELLKSNNIPVIEHNILYSSNNKNEYAKDCNKLDLVKKYFKKNNNNIVIKPNDGTCGRNVFNITNENEINSCLNKMFKNNFSISYCPYYDIKYEYRIIVLNKKIRLAYMKIRPIVIGNNNNSIKELLLKFNYNYFKDKLNDEKYDRILKDKEIYEHNWKFNLSHGSIAKIININNYDKIEKIINEILEKIDINFASIDVIETLNGDYYVLEINSGVMMDNLFNMIDDKNIIMNIYKDAIKSMFNMS